MTTTTPVEPQFRRRALTARPTVLAVLHPKGGVGRSTTVWQLGAELALRGKRVRIEDLDQGRHLSRVFERHPLGMDSLQLANGTSATYRSDIDLILLDTAPEAHREHALGVPHRADWRLVPVKGEEGRSRRCPCSCSGSGVVKLVAKNGERCQQARERRVRPVSTGPSYGRMQSRVTLRQAVCASVRTCL
jgi:hypothetical protein